MTKSLRKFAAGESVALLASLALLIQPLPAQDSVATSSVHVKVVTLPVTVRDKHGQIVRNLTRDLGTGELGAWGQRIWSKNLKQEPAQPQPRRGKPA